MPTETDPTTTIDDLERCPIDDDPAALQTVVLLTPKGLAVAAELERRAEARAKRWRAYHEAMWWGHRARLARAALGRMFQLESFLASMGAPAPIVAHVFRGAAPPRDPAIVGHELGQRYRRAHECYDASEAYAADARADR